MVEPAVEVGSGVQYAAEPAVIPRHPGLVSAEQEFLAEHLARRSTVQTTREDTSDTMAESAKTSHYTDDKVRMWKPTKAGYRVREVPTGLIALNLKSGWKPVCPHCGQDCGNDTNDCAAFPPSPVAYCPKAGCRHKINLRNLGLDFKSQDEAKQDPNAVDMGYTEADEMSMLRAAMDTHIITRHPQEARILLGSRFNEIKLIPTI